MKRRLLLLTVFFLCFLVSEKSFGLNDLLRVSNISPETVQSLPKKVVTISFLVSNISGRSQELLEEVILPEGWSALFPPTSLLKLAAGSQEVRIFGFMVPQDTLTGQYEISYSLFNPKDRSLLARDSVFIEILPVTQFQLILVDRPKMVIAGDEFILHFRLINKGNSEVSVSLEATFEPPAVFTSEFSDLKLKPGAGADLKIKVKTDSKMKEKLTQFFRVRARAVAANNQEVVESSEGLVEILPRVSGEFDPFVRIPGRFCLRNLGNNSAAGFQAELGGSGPLGDEGRLAYLLKTPGPRTGGVFAQPENYNLSYYSPNFDVYMGDGGYRLSSLTEENFDSRGVEVTGRLGNFTTGGFYAFNRPSSVTQKEAGARLACDFGPWLNLGLNYLNKKKPSQELENGHIWGVQLASWLWEKNKFTGELALSRSTQNEGARDKAWQGRLDGQIININYFLEKKYAGPEFASFQRNLDFLAGNFFWPMFENLNFSFYGQKWRDNLDFNPASEIATSEKLYRSSLAYQPLENTSFSLGYETFDREDLLAPVDFNFKQQNFKLNWNQVLNRVSLDATLERGRLDDHLLAETFGTSGYSVYTYYSLSPSQRFGIFYKAGQYEFNGSPDWHTTIGLSIDWQLLGNLWWDFIYQKNDHTSQQFNSNFKYILFENQLVEAGFNYYDFYSLVDDQVSFFVSYSIPWAMPVGLKGNIGSLRGKIYDAQKPDKPGIKNVVLKIGQATAVTDSKGEFFFPMLKAGQNFLMVERGSIGLERTLTETLPLEVNIEGTRVKKIEIGVIDAARLTGRVAVFEKQVAVREQVAATPGGEFVLESGRVVPKTAGAGEGLEEVSGLEDILLELSNEKETLRRVTDSRGRFSFEDLKPGRWTLKINNFNLPPLHYLEKETLIIELAPGEIIELPVFRVLPQKREIQIIEEGKIK